MRIALAGSGRLAHGMLEALLHSRHEIVAVVENGRDCRGWRRGWRRWSESALNEPSSLVGYAAALGLPLLWLDRMTEDEIAPLRAANPDLLLVAGFGIILAEAVLRLPRIGCVNTHSSLLPRHRGPNPFYAVVRDGDQESGVTFHIMEPRIDSGAIVDQTSFVVGARPTMMQVYSQSCAIAAARVVDVMDRIARDGLHGQPQDESKATYDRRPSEDDAWIPWHASAADIDRRVRALVPVMLPCFRHGRSLVRVVRVGYDDEAHGVQPGTVLRNEPTVRVAAGAGSVDLLTAFTEWPITLPWPRPLSRPAVGHVLPEGPRRNRN